MNHILGLIDAFEGEILEGKKIPFTDKVVIDEKKILILIDKLRLVIKKGNEVVRDSLAGTTPTDTEHMAFTKPGTTATLTQINPNQKEAMAIAKEKSEKIVEETNAYSDYILANLQLMVTKMQKNLINIEKSLESTRKLIETEEVKQ